MEAVIDSELFSHRNPPFHPATQIVRHCCFTDSVQSIEQPCLGHKDLSGTQRYLTMTEELLAEASRRFEAFAQGGRHD
jgi:hypothetical protein